MLKFGSKNYTIRVEATMPKVLEKGQTVEVFSTYMESENESFSMERLEGYVLHQLLAAGYKRPEANKPGQVYVLVDRYEVRKTKEYEDKELKIHVCGQQILDYLDEGYSAANDLPFNFVFNAKQQYDSGASVNKLISNFGGEDKRTVQQKELDEVCTSMSRKEIRQKIVVEDRLILDGIPAKGYFSGDPQPSIWRVKIEGGGGIPSLLVASGRAIKRGESGQWEEKVVTSESDYIAVHAYNK